MRRLLSAATAAAALGALAATAAATIVLRVTPRELADIAHVVVEGRVATVDVRWDSDRTCINTYAVVNVERTHKGRPGGSVTVKVPGGRVGDEEVKVDGTAEFKAGEECFLFLWKDGKGEWVVLGEAQGKFNLRHDAKTGRRMAENSLKGLCLVVRGDPKKAEASGAKRPDCLCVEDLVAVVAASVEAQRKFVPSTGSNGTPAGGPAPGTSTAPAADPASPTGGGAASTAPAPSGTQAGTQTGNTTVNGDPAGRVPAPHPATPEPPSTTTTTGAGAPPPAKDVPAPPAGTSATPEPADGKPKPPPPAPEKN